MTSIVDIEGIGSQYADKLKALGIATVEALLDKGATPAGRHALAEQSAISSKLILRWVNHADLFRIKGIAGQYAELLEAAGVDTVVELAKRNAQNLFHAMVACNEEKKLVRVTPAQSRVEEWVAQANTLPRVVKY
jgi:predicted flap endonuclease-1-like 5' DNA nuclease